MNYISYLKKLVPDIQLTRRNFIEVVIDQDLEREEKIARVLLNHFNSEKNRKTKYVDDHCLETEAEYINELFPTLTRNYILEQLELFKDMSRRVNIVLRIIVNSKISEVGGKSGSSKRIIPNEMNHQNYYKPSKIRKIRDENYAFNAVDNSQTDNNFLLPLLLRSDFVNTDFVKKVDKPCCTVTSATANLQVQNDNLENNSTMDLSFPKQKLTENMNCDSSNYIAEPPLPVSIIMDSSVVSSSDEILNSGNSSAILGNTTDEPGNLIKEEGNRIIEDENITVNSSTINESTFLHFSPGKIDDVDEILNSDKSSVILETNFDEPENLVKHEENEKLQDENSFMINDSSFLDFFTEMQEVLTIPDSQESETPKETEIIPPETSHEAETEDSEKTVLLSPDDTNVQYVDDVPSTSKKSDMPEGNFLEQILKKTDLPEEFDLIEYIREVTSAPISVIVKQCEKKSITDFSIKPSLLILEEIIDNLLTNSISSENEDDPDAVKIITEAQSTSMSSRSSESVIEGAKTTENYVAMVSVEKLEPQPKKTKIPRISSSQKDERVDQTNIQLVNYLCGIFPDACPDYIKGLCQNKPMNNEVVDELTTVILSSNDGYPKRPKVQPEPDIYPENQLDILKEFLPDADPDYLRMKCDSFEGKPDLVKDFLNQAMERRDYPTMKEYQRRQQLSAQQKQYTTEFNVENFVKLIPDPHNFFMDSSRLVIMDALSIHYAHVFLRNAFPKISVRAIQSTFNKNNLSLAKTYRELVAMMSQSHMLMKSTRKQAPMPYGMQNIPLLQEIAYLSHQGEIDNYLAEIKAQEEAERQEALRKGLMKSCNCCYDEEVLPKDIFMCGSGCSFCKSCIVKSTEVLFGEGKLHFPCLMDCGSHFTLQTLQAVLSPKLFSKIAQKKALEEIKAAGIEELETCPFCDFATIPAAGYPIFSCLNPDCMKESCRHCKEPSHIPLRCDEIEKDEDVKARVFVENKMTEALLRKCYKCGIKFFKEEGCNKMTCSCGASMCYVCGEPVTDYKHFNGMGGDRFELCPLYSDTNVLNKENVLKAAEQAKTEIGRELKHDPTADIHEVYRERAARFPGQEILAQQQREAQVYLVRLRDALLEQRRRHHHHH